MERMKILVEKFRPYTESSKFFDVVWSKGRALYLDYDGAGDDAAISPRVIETWEELLEDVYLHQISSDVRDLGLVGEHLYIDLFPAEVEETRRRVLPYLSGLPFEDACIKVMESYLEKAGQDTAP